jgi:hypothetical protein
MQARSVATMVAMTKPLIGGTLILQDQPQKKEEESVERTERERDNGRGKARRNSPEGK